MTETRNPDEDALGLTLPKLQTVMDKYRSTSWFDEPVYARKSMPLTFAFSVPEHEVDSVCLTERQWNAMRRGERFEVRLLRPRTKLLVKLMQLTENKMAPALVRIMIRCVETDDVVITGRINQVVFTQLAPLTLIMAGLRVNHASKYYPKEEQ